MEMRFTNIVALQQIANKISILIYGMKYDRLIMALGEYEELLQQLYITVQV
ncbi:hypothetical protein D3C77_557130 [compost metagenome]